MECVLCCVEGQDQDACRHGLRATSRLLLAQFKAHRQSQSFSAIVPGPKPGLGERVGYYTGVHRVQTELGNNSK